MEGALRPHRIEIAKPAPMLQRCNWDRRSRFRHRAFDAIPAKPQNLTRAGAMELEKYTTELASLDMDGVSEFTRK